MQKAGIQKANAQETRVQRARKRKPLVELVVPVYNAEKELENCVHKLLAFTARQTDWRWRITIANNASTDNTLAIARRLARRWRAVKVLHIPRKGRGGALRAAWLASRADIVAYTDVDLSTDLGALPIMLRRLAAGADIAIGNRLMPGSRVHGRSLARELFSRGYNALLLLVFRTRISDAQCGFKALTRRAARQLVPLVVNRHWFFDSELLLRAERLGCSIAQVPVTWVESAETTVNVPKTVKEYLTEVARLKLEFLGLVKGAAQPAST